MDYEVTNSMRVLHPLAMGAFVRLHYRLQDAFDTGKIGQLFLPFETYRHPARQLELLSKGQGVTKAGAFQSAHQYGLAVDFVPFLMKGPRRGWDWGHDNQWDTMKQLAKAEGLLVPFDWDKAHVVHPVWNKINRLLAAEPKDPPAPGTKVP